MFWQWLEIPEGSSLLDFGGGTGSNVESLGERLGHLSQLTIVDLWPSLLRTAEQRIREKGWTNVATLLADCTTLAVPEEFVDIVTFSYSSTMIPEWFQAIERACALLRPGSTIADVDFFVSRKWPAASRAKHSALERLLWPWWFSHDNVFISADHLPFLQSRFATFRLKELKSNVPYPSGSKRPSTYSSAKKHRKHSTQILPSRSIIRTIS